MGRYYDDNFNVERGPEPGDGATQGVGSDSYAYTIVDVSSERVKATVRDHQGEMIEVMWPKWIEVIQDDAKVVRGSGQDGSAEYEYETRLDSSATRFILKDGRYRQATRKYRPETRSYEVLNSCRKDAPTMSVGFRRYYRDPSF